MTPSIEKAINLQSKGHFEAAKDLLVTILAESPHHPEATHYLGLNAYENKDFMLAFRLLENSLDISPDNEVFKSNLALAKKQYKERQQIMEHMRIEVSKNPNDYVRMNTLAAAYMELGQSEDARHVGQRSLSLQDKLKVDNAKGEKGVPSAEKPAFDPTNRGRNIIAFSLWGDDVYYTDGAIENARLAGKLFPGWQCRFYVDDSISSATIEDLQHYGSQVVSMPSNGDGKFGLFWRFFVAADPEVDYFLCRDCDCRLNLKEKHAVEEWLSLGSLFHVMRDNINHLMLMPAGLWGGVGGLLPEIIESAKSYYAKSYQHGMKKTEWIDQEFLSDVIWPQIAHRTLTYDSNYQLRSTRRFPSEGDLVPPAHVGGAVPRPGERNSTARRPIRRG